MNNIENLFLAFSHDLKLPFASAWENRKYDRWFSQNCMAATFKALDETTRSIVAEDYAVYINPKTYQYWLHIRGVCVSGPFVYRVTRMVMAEDDSTALRVAPNEELEWYEKYEEIKTNVWLQVN